MTSFQNVALLGKGMLGTAILEQLVRSGYAVTLLSRDPSNIEGVPSDVKVVQVDYSSKDSLVQALKGQDAAIATLGGAALAGQKLIIDASIEAGVKRYIPSDFGSFTTDPKARDLPAIQVMAEIQGYLREKANSGALEYTIFSTGAFLEYVLASPFVADLKNHSMELYDKGVHKFSSTSVSTIGKAITNALKVPDATKNRNLLIHEAVFTQAKILELAKKHSPPGTQWTVTQVDAQEALDRGIELINSDPTNPHAAFPLIKAAVLSGKYRAAYDTVDNELLGIRLLTDEEIELKISAAV
ncbi:related to 2`-hydroxyisoflavone reductase [Fusarium proliferatum ET1]|uniref:Related to 2`-hydroxyisoflavone reductase n=1 Tax=Fusarium proliferatum (strain ET1) TaxID=1227346 RepID=A0A1L7VQD6_FUSPR|nr:related to 2`-hydroxyisoflavone reductase [Fusarium proliferatum ET1]CZR42683.1 related to 2`-hydroxyisoflavone reductase [Fusarium proliferatum ET1]